QVTMYDCMEYEDGTPSPWDEKRIRRIKAMCKNDAEIQRRVYGRFVIDEGLKYPMFERSKNMAPQSPVPKDWHIYAAVDVGSGGAKGHPAAIAFVAVRPDFRFGRVILGRRGDGIETTASDILTKFLELRGNFKCVAQYYDWQARDFHTIATRLGEPSSMADEDHES